MSTSDSVAFDIDKQGAVLGWCLKAPEFFFKFQHVAKETWFLDPSHGAIYKAILDLHSKTKRVPTATEIQLWQGFKDQDQLNRARIETALKKAVEKANGIGLDILETDLDNWIYAKVISDTLSKANQAYNQKDLQKAIAFVRQCVTQIESSSFSKGVSEGFKSSEERIVQEEALRMLDFDRIIPYGVSVLDSPLGGMMPTDCIIVGSESGRGKTSLCTSTALINARTSGGVFYFALEAEENEIEMRMKYSMIAQEYYRTNWHQPIRYLDWRQGKLRHLLRDIEGSQIQNFKEAVRGMKTLYRTSGEFTLDNLDQKLQEIQHDAKLVIIDHLHYIDVDDNKEENRVYSKVIKRVRDLVLTYRIPIIVVCHLRKLEQGKARTLVPSMADFHGTSNISKIATVAIMLAQAEDQMASAPGLSPTYMRIVKSRLDGSLIKFTNLIEYNVRTNLFEPTYRVGKLVNGGKEWEQITTNLPFWAETVSSSETH